MNNLRETEEYLIKKRCQSVSQLLPKNLSISAVSWKNDHGHIQYIIYLNSHNPEMQVKASREIFRVPDSHDFSIAFFTWYEDFVERLNALHFEHFSQIVIHG